MRTSARDTALFFFFVLAVLFLNSGCEQFFVRQKPSPDNATHIVRESYSPPLKLYVTARSVNIRSGPGLGNTVVGSAKRGQKLSVYGKVEDWYTVHLHGSREGYIYENLLSASKPKQKHHAAVTGGVDAGHSSTALSNEQLQKPVNPALVEEPNLPSSAEQAPPLGEPGLLEDKPAKALQPAIKTLTPGKARLNELAAVKVRASASPFSKVSGELAPGAEIIIIDIRGDWCRIRSGAITGYITAFSVVQ